MALTRGESQTSPYPGCVLKMEPLRGIEPRSLPYQGSALPLIYKGMSYIHILDDVIQNVDLVSREGFEPPLCR